MLFQEWSDSCYEVAFDSSMLTKRKQHWNAYKNFDDIRSNELSYEDIGIVQITYANLAGVNISGFASLVRDV